LNVASAASRCDLVDDHGGRAPPGIVGVVSMAGHRAKYRRRQDQDGARPRRSTKALRRRTSLAMLRYEMLSGIVADQKQEDQLSVGHAIDVRGWGTSGQLF
jgi:hypothetical protein